MTKVNYFIIDPTEEERKRVLSKVVIDPITNCWNWTAALNTYGYGEVWFHQRMEVTHRWFYAWYNGPIPKGIGPDIPNIDHICNNKRCCNPDHLRLVLPQFNLIRGNSISSINKRKTHCIRGHLLPIGSNRTSGYGRTCKVCKKITGHIRYLMLRYGKDNDQYLSEIKKYSK